MKKVIALIATLSLVLSVSGCSLFTKDPQKAVDEGFAKFADVNKMNSILKLSGTLKAPAGEKPETIQFELDASGKMDTSDSENPKIDVAFKADATVDGQKYSGDFMIKASDKKVFVKVGSLQMPGEGGKALNTQLASVLNVWWSLPASEDSTLSKYGSQQAEFRELLKNTKFFTGAREEAKEMIQGSEMTKYRVDLDKEALKKFLLEMIRISGSQLQPEEEVAIGERLKEIETSGALWIGGDNYMHRIQGTVTSQPKQGPSTSFEIDYTSWDFGKDVTVEAPAGAQEFNPLMLLPILGAFSSVGQEAAVPAAGDLGAKQVAPKAVTPVKK
ncbi:MAG: hypothetical protein WCT53_00725 [Candidatus Gracilibacteria bacterium]|jgi:hypothetical protein